MLKNSHRINRIAFIILPVIITSLLFHCDSIDPLSPGPQPVILESTEYEPFLNVFGILRPDSMMGVPSSFVHLEFAYPASDMPDSSLITDADVQIRRLDGDSVLYSFDFVYTSFDGFFNFEYRHRSFFPEDGHYQLCCQKQGFPVLTAETVMPGIPIIREGSLRHQDEYLLFELVRDERAGLYEVVFNNGLQTIHDRFLRPETGDVPVTLLTGSCGSCQLTIYAFDPNLSAYLTSNLSIKPDIYQDNFSTVTNGYGCFGSLNILQRVIEVE